MNLTSTNSLITKKGVMLALLGIIMVFYAVVLPHYSYTPDDSYIYFQYAKNIVHGNGVAFNKGDPTFGITGPLWMFIVSAAAAPGFDIYTAAKSIDLIFAGIGLIIFYFVAFELAKEPIAALCATAAFSSNIWFMRWAGSGMDTTLAVLLLLLLFLHLFREEFIGASVYAALLTLVRPEALLLMPVVLAVVLFGSAGRQKKVGRMIGMAAIMLLMLLPWLIFAEMTFGTILPNTLGAKSGVAFSWYDVGVTFVDLIRTLVVSDGITIAALLIAGIGIVIVRKKVDRDDRLMILRASVGIIWMLMLSTLYCLKGVNIVSRYLLLFTPIVTAIAFAYLVAWVKNSKLYRYNSIPIYLLAIAIISSSQITYHAIVLPGVEGFEEGMEQTLIPIGKWLNKNTPENSVVVTADIGAIGYYSERTVFDAAGLVSPSMLDLFRQGYSPYDIIEKQKYLPFCRPDYVIDRGYEPEQMKNEKGFFPFLTLTFEKMSLSETRPIYYTIYKFQPATKLAK